MESRALGEARRCFSGGGLYRGCDLDDDYVRQVFGGLDPLQPGFRFDSARAPETTPAPNGAPPSFADVALRVYAPLLSHREEMA
jgi:hypothetical protein